MAKEVQRLMDAKKGADRLRKGRESKIKELPKRSGSFTADSSSSEILKGLAEERGRKERLVRVRRSTFALLELWRWKGGIVYEG